MVPIINLGCTPDNRNLGIAFEYCPKTGGQNTKCLLLMALKRGLFKIEL